MKIEDLNIDLAIAELLAMGKAEYPDDHKAGMEVPEGGSDCAKCEYVRSDGTECANKFFQQWHGSNKLPLPANRYCCDWFESADGEIKAYGTSEGVRKEWESRIRNAHGISVDIFNRYNRPNPDAISVRTFLEHDPPSMKERVKLAKAFLSARGPIHEDVSMDSLIPLQNTVFKDKVEEIRSEGMYRNPIDVFRYEGKNYVMDGHHRLAVWSMEDHDTIPANIYQIPGDKRDLNAGGPGSGCHGPNCGRPSEGDEDPHEAAQNFMDAVQNWQTGSHYIRHAALAIITGQRDNVDFDNQAEKDAQQILDGIRNGDEFNRPLYRGVSITKADDPVMQLKPGDEFQLPMQSFSTNLGVAHGFAIGKQQGDTHVVFQIEGHSKGLDIGKAAGDTAYKEVEVVTNGKFRVENISDEHGFGPGMFHVIHVSQQGLL